MRPRAHYLEQLEALHAELRALGQTVVDAITQSVDAFAKQDAAEANRIIAGDQAIDRAQYALEEHTLVVMATQQPIAGDLRRLIAAIEIASELERMGDYAKGIAKVTVRSVDQPPFRPLDDIAQMAQHAIEMLVTVLDTFVREDAEAARRLAIADDSVDELAKRIKNDLISLMQSSPMTVAWAVDLISVTHNLERIADRTTNIAERVIFMVSGDQVELNP